MLLKSSAYEKSYDGQTKSIYFLMTYWKNVILLLIVNTDIKKEFDSEPVYNKKILKTK